MSDLVKRYTASVFFDKRLWQADITGSLAHADMTGIKHAGARRLPLHRLDPARDEATHHGGFIEQLRLGA